MRPIQQDDIQDYLNAPKATFRWIHMPTGKIVPAVNKGAAINQFKSSYNISCLRSEVRQAKMTE